MGIDAITKTAIGQTVNPSSKEEWSEWVSATSSRNYMLKNPLIDWLALYGRKRGYGYDYWQSDYDKRCEFTTFIMRQGVAFEESVKNHLSTLEPVVTISKSPSAIRSLDKAIATFNAMRDGQPIIHQGVLRHPGTRTYGAPDFLIRSDILRNLFPEDISALEAEQPASDLGGHPWHYVVVDVKFTTLHLLMNGELANAGSSMAYKAQLYTYSRALENLQGYPLRQGFLLGRAWQQGSGSKSTRGTSAMERLGPITFDPGLSSSVTEAEIWVRRVRADGHKWSILPTPTVEELWPNMGETSDFPWHAAKINIARELSEITLLWQVGLTKRVSAHQKGLYSWQDHGVQASSLGLSGDSATKLDAILAVNRGSNGPAFQPDHVISGEEVWRDTPPVEFYVDFEVVSDLNDDFSNLPYKGGQPLIFLIGCGHIYKGEWVFKSFVADHLTEAAEACIINAWVTHMDSVQDTLATDSSLPYVFHWSPAEVSFLETSYNSAQQRHPEQHWPQLGWYDLLANVAKAEPIVVRGSLGFGLKSIVTAMNTLGLIDVQWPNSSIDGLGAMAGAWWCDKEALNNDTTLGTIPLMKEIVAYNEIDCKAMMAILRYLRENH